MVEGGLVLPVRLTDWLYRNLRVFCLFESVFLAILFDNGGVSFFRLVFLDEESAVEYGLIWVAGGSQPVRLTGYMRI